MPFPTPGLSPPPPEYCDSVLRLYVYDIQNEIRSLVSLGDGAAGGGSGSGSSGLSAGPRGGGSLGSLSGNTPGGPGTGGSGESSSKRSGGSGRIPTGGSKKKKENYSGPLLFDDAIEWWKGHKVWRKFCLCVCERERESNGKYTMYVICRPLTHLRIIFSYKHTIFIPALCL